MIAITFSLSIAGGLHDRKVQKNDLVTSWEGKCNFLQNAVEWLCIITMDGQTKKKKRMGERITAVRSDPEKSN